MKKRIRKLALAKETLRTLGAESFRQAVGAAGTRPSINTCYATCTEFSVNNTCNSCVQPCATEVSGCITDCGC